MAERSVWHAGAKFVGSDEAAGWRHREAANAPTLGGAGASEPAAVLDANALDRLRELDPSGANRVIERVVAAFEASATRLIPKLRESARTGDLEGVKHVAHTLRSASASVGALKLSCLCADMESQARAEDRTELAARVKSLVAEIDVVLSVLRSLPASRT